MINRERRYRGILETTPYKTFEFVYTDLLSGPFSNSFNNMLL